jgi:hypothetical protein
VNRGQLAFAFVLLVWLALLVRAGVFVASDAARFPIADDVAIWGLTPPLGDFSWESLWALHNEHRVPLPRLILFGLSELTGDLRSGMYLELALLGLSALALLLVARQLRGRSSFADVFFPLVWLHTGNAENLLSSWQLVETLPIALVCVLLALAASSARPLRSPRALLASGCALCLPLCGGVGLVQLPAWAAWMAFAARSGWRSEVESERRAARILLGSLCVLGIVCAGYLSGFSHTGHVYTSSPGDLLPTSGALLALALGPAAESWWPASCALVLLALLSTLVVLGGRLRRERAERLRVFGLLAALAGTITLVLVVAVARGNIGYQAGFADRYVSLTAPLLCSAYLAWTIYGNRLQRGIACATLALALAAAWPQNEAHGREYGERRRAAAERFETLARERAPVGEILAHYSRTFVVAPEIARVLLRLFAVEGRPPFDGGRAPPEAAFEFPALRAFPARVESASPSRNTLADRDAVLLVEAPLAIRLPLRAEERWLRGRFGIPELLIAPRRSRKLRFTIELAPQAGEHVQLLERVLDSNNLEADRMLQALEIELPAHAAGELVLRAEVVDPAEPGLRWTAWSAIELR